MTARLCRFAMRAYPPALYVPLTFLWAAGLTGLLVAAEQPGGRGLSVAGVGITAATLFVDMLALRALDDIRDADYDRAHAPGRPLPSGVVSVSDLVTLVAIGVAALLALNIGRGAALVVLAVQLGYAIGLVTVNTRLAWPASENTLLQLAINIPIQMLLSIYVYVAFLRAGHLPAQPAGLLATVAVMCALIHAEFARKATRAPADAERTYVHHIGLGGTVAAAVVSAVLAAALATATVRPWDASSSARGWGWLALAPLAVPAAAGWSFWRRRLPRWPARGALSFPVCACAAFLVIGLVGNARPH